MRVKAAVLVIVELDADDPTEADELLQSHSNWIQWNVEDMKPTWEVYDEETKEWVHFRRES